MRTIGLAADRLLRLVVPHTTAAAICAPDTDCTPCYNGHRWCVYTGWREGVCRTYRVYLTCNT